MGVSKNNGTPKSSILIGFSIIFTIHFGVPLFLETSISVYPRIWKPGGPTTLVANPEDTGSFSEYLADFEGQPVARAFSNLGGTLEDEGGDEGRHEQ